MTDFEPFVHTSTKPLTLEQIESMWNCVSKYWSDDMSDKVLDVLRAMAIERAKGEINAALNTYYSCDDFEEKSDTVDKIFEMLDNIFG